MTTENTLYAAFKELGDADPIVTCIYEAYAEHLASYEALEDELRHRAHNIDATKHAELHRVLTREADSFAANRRGAETWAARYLRTIAKCRKPEKTEESEQPK